MARLSQVAAPLSEVAGQPDRGDEFAKLKRLIVQSGLLEKQPVFYACKILLTFALLGLSVTFLVIAESLWLHLLNAAFMAFVFGQIGFLGHDGGHLQIYRSVRRNDHLLIIVTSLIGLGRSWWVDKHNRHHKNPNNVDQDFDVNLPLLAFTEEQALEKKGLYRWVVRYQAFFFFPMMMLEAFSIRADGAQYLMRGRDVRYPRAESIATVAHFVAYFGLLYTFLPPLHATLFLLVHQALTGLYLGNVFAPNHKGMPMIGNDSQIGFLRQQIVTARNIKGGFITRMLYGGLNLQIEHHLFPTMPMNKLPRAQRIVREFCQEQSIPYHETGLLNANWEILRCLHQVSSPLRRKVSRVAPDSG